MGGGVAVGGGDGCVVGGVAVGGVAVGGVVVVGGVISVCSGWCSMSVV